MGPRRRARAGRRPTIAALVCQHFGRASVEYRCHHSIAQ